MYNTFIYNHQNSVFLFGQSRALPKLDLWFIYDKIEKGNTNDQKSVDIYYFRYNHL